MSQSERRLAAIMFTDIVGYTTLTQNNEPLALKLLERHRDLIRPALSRYGGREVKTIGDAFLVEFGSALQATECAFEIQKILHEYNESASDKISLKIGIHVGDVIHTQGDVYGDAVNIASRIEPLAKGGGVCISGQVYDQVRNKILYQTTKLETGPLKNISLPTDVYRLDLPWERGDVPDNIALPSNRIAVLPFVNISPDPNDEFFADGLTEELITNLSLVKGLKIIARTSVMNYKKKEKNISVIGKELGVGTVVEGSVRKAANRIRVTVQVIDANTEEHLWASNYDRSLDDIFAVQSDIASRVSEAIPSNISKLKPAQVLSKTEDVRAYMYFLQGKHIVH
ncbi:MAG: adenylate/guanylate cyclase domain-containing protein, partial [Nitrososphaerales archaeon]